MAEGVATVSGSGPSAKTTALKSGMTLQTKKFNIAILF
jgi:hypothetical protein